MCFYIIIRDLLHPLYYYTYARSASGLDGSLWQKMATIIWQRMDNDPVIQKKLHRYLLNCTLEES